MKTSFGRLTQRLIPIFQKKKKSLDSGTYYYISLSKLEPLTVRLKHHLTDSHAAGAKVPLLREYPSYLIILALTTVTFDQQCFYFVPHVGHTSICQIQKLNKHTFYYQARLESKINIAYTLGAGSTAQFGGGMAGLGRAETEPLPSHRPLLCCRAIALPRGIIEGVPMSYQNYSKGCWEWKACRLALTDRCDLYNAADAARDPGIYFTFVSSTRVA